MRLTVGDVIRWDDFPYPRNGPIKARWFIVLGQSSSFSIPIFAYLCTTTTQLQKFEASGERSRHLNRRFDVRQFPIFDADCILDFEEDLHPVTEETLERCWHSIEIRGRLDNETLRNIYNNFSRSDSVSKKILLDIHESFNRNGITGLKKPK